MQLKKRHGNKVNEFLKKSFVFVLALILLCEITAFKNLIKELFTLIQSYNLFNFELIQIKELYLFLRKYALIYLVLCIIFFVLIRVYLFIRDYFNSPKSSELNGFEDSLYKYINEKSNRKGYLVTGEWGSGKTHIVNEFFDKYYKFSKKPLYRISCFGIDSRKLILEEIKSQIEIHDTSLFNWIQYIPGIGKPIFSMIKGSYSLNSIPKDAVFIFDDFERITSLGIHVDERMGSYNKDFRVGYNPPQDIKAINDEFIKIEKAFEKYDQNNEIISITSDLQKYNVVTGLINELIENYNVKAIIICNVDILGYGFVDKVFRGKLDCVTYNKSVDKNSIESIFNSTFQNQIYANKDVEELLASVINDLKVDFEKVWFSNGKSNLREVKSVIQAFLDTANMIIPKVNVNKNYLISLFYSIYVVRVLRDSNELKNLNEFLTGGSLAFFLNLYRKHSVCDLLKISDHFERLKWTGIPIAGFWIFNMKKPDDLDNSVRCFIDYEYNDLEMDLLRHDDNSLSGRKMLVEHIVYIMKRERRIPSEGVDTQIDELSSYIKVNLKYMLEYNQDSEQLMEEKVRNFLVKLHVSLVGGYKNSDLEKLYEEIYEYSKVESVLVEKNRYTIQLYNEYVQKHKCEEELV
ncbi:P-loop NTPase fold protein [Bacillus thuringiensis]|uniref:P-loop NTPase fold protein n=1 Tax=Bacillus cereus group TaxID=86661 RepID=UPI00345B6105